MDTKTAMQIANLLKEQAENIKEIVKDYEEGTVSYKGYDFSMDVRLLDLKTIVEEFEFRQKNQKCN